MLGARLLAAPLMAAVGIGALVEHSHGLVGGPDLNLHEVCLLVLALAAVSYNNEDQDQTQQLTIIFRNS